MLRPPPPTCENGSGDPEAWLAAKFGRHRSLDSVRLIPEHEQWPDFEARDSDGCEQIECAEADILGRRRGHEYREVLGVQDDPVENWIVRADQAPIALSAAIRAKVAKRYGSRASLLVYLNIGEYDLRQAEIEAAMSPAVMPALPFFTRVWILWNARLYGPWAE